MTLKTDSINIENICEKMLRFELLGKFTFSAHLDGIIHPNLMSYLEILQL